MNGINRSSTHANIIPGTYSNAFQNFNYKQTPFISLDDTQNKKKKIPYNEFRKRILIYQNKKYPFKANKMTKYDVYNYQTQRVNDKLTGKHYSHEEYNSLIGRGNKNENKVFRTYIGDTNSPNTLRYRPYDIYSLNNPNTMHINKPLLSLNERKNNLHNISPLEYYNLFYMNDNNFTVPNDYFKHENEKTEIVQNANDYINDKAERNIIDSIKRWRTMGQSEENIINLLNFEFKDVDREHLERMRENSIILDEKQKELEHLYNLPENVEQRKHYDRKQNIITMLNKVKEEVNKKKNESKSTAIGKPIPKEDIKKFKEESNIVDNKPTFSFEDYEEYKKKEREINEKNLLDSMAEAERIQEIRRKNRYPEKEAPIDYSTYKNESFKNKKPATVKQTNTIYNKLFDEFPYAVSQYDEYTLKDLIRDNIDHITASYLLKNNNINQFKGMKDVTKENLPLYIEKLSNINGNSIEENIRDEPGVLQKKIKISNELYKKNKASKAYNTLTPELKQLYEGFSDDKKEIILNLPDNRSRMDYIVRATTPDNTNVLAIAGPGDRRRRR